MAADDLKFLMEDEPENSTRIKVVGVGGGGSNAVGRMLQEGLHGIDFYVLNTDKQALNASLVANKVALGKEAHSRSRRRSGPCGRPPVCSGRYRAGYRNP